MTALTDAAPALAAGDVLDCTLLYIDGAWVPSDGAGRIAACETMIPTPAVRNLIREGKTHQILSAMQTGSASGMQTMDSALASLVRAGKITQRMAEGASSTPEELRRMSGAGGFGMAA